MTRRHPFHSPAARYALAVALIAVAVWANRLLAAYMEPSTAPLLFAAVLVAAWQGGWGPGLLATVLATLADDYYFIAPIGSIEFDAPVRVRLGVFLAVSLLTSYLTAQRRRAIADRDRSLALEHDARLSAERANATKDHFLAVTSHELRSPLGGLCLWTEVLAGLPLGGEAREATDAINGCARSMQRLIEDLLDVARLEAGKLRVEPERLPLGPAVQAAARAVEPLAAAKDIAIRVEGPAAPADLWADPARFAQVLTNLLTNAVKFTPAGGSVRVDAAVDAHARAATVRVSDTGRGLAAADLPHVFDRFWQVGQTNASAGNGLGLGLAIVRDLVTLHGGTVRAHSDGPGTGAAFVVTLPLAPVQARP